MTRSVFTAAGEISAPSDAKPLELEPTADSLLRGQLVEEPKGQPLMGATVLVEGSRTQQDGSLAEKVTLKALTDADGQFTVDLVPFVADQSPPLTTLPALHLTGIAQPGVQGRSHRRPSHRLPADAAGSAHEADEWRLLPDQLWARRRTRFLPGQRRPSCP